MAEQGVDVGIQATVMAIRERLMEYYKGTCVERFTVDTNVHIDANSAPRLQYQYQRLAWERNRKSTVFIGDLPIMTIERSPEKVTFNQKILDRSPQLRAIYEELILFMEKYLGAIEVIHDQREVYYANR